MGGSDYYCLAASLRELSLDVDAKEINVASLFDDIEDNLSESDLLLYKSFRAQYDIQNLADCIAGRVLTFNPMGNLTKEIISEIAEAYLDSKPENNFFEKEFYGLEPSIVNVLTAYKDTVFASEYEIETTIALDKTMQNIYYQNMTSADNTFIRDWFNFDIDVRNICAAFTARAKHQDIENVIVGEGDIQSQLKISSAPDFGLKGMFDFTDELIALLSIDDMLLKERKLDEIRWDKINDLITFDYFTTNTILGYVAKAAIIARWLNLDEKTGRKMFEKLIKELSENKIKIEL